MKTTEMYCRDIFCLSNKEIVKLIDFVFNDVNLDRLVSYLYEERPSTNRRFNYRKIEVYSSYYEWAYILKVTFIFEGLNREVTTGFLIAMEGGPGDEQFYERDVHIQSVAGFFRTMEGVIWKKGIADDFGIEIDFSVFQVYVRKLQNFLSNTLKLWSGHLTSDKYEWNLQIRDLLEDNPIRSFIVEEIVVSESEGN